MTVGVLLLSWVRLLLLYGATVVASDVLHTHPRLLCDLHGEQHGWDKHQGERDDPNGMDDTEKHVDTFRNELYG